MSSVTLPAVHWERVLAPGSIAVVGASEDSYYARSLFANLDQHGYRGTVIPVHPRRSTAFGRVCHPSLTAAPPADLVVVAVNRTLVDGVFDEAVETGAAGVVVLAAGYSDSGERAWIDAEERLRERAARAGVAVLGPNTLGLLSMRANAFVFATPVTHTSPPGDVALIMQSGGLVSGAARYLDGMRVGLQYAIGVGNARVTPVAEWLQALSADEHVSVIGLLLESLGDWTAFRAAAEAAANAGKTVVLCKTGRTAAGQAVALSHTGAVATDYAVLEGALEQVGVHVVSSINELVLATALFSRFGRSRRPGLGVIGQSGGGNGQLADQCGERGIHLAAPHSATIERATVGGRYAPVGNPADLADHAMTDLEAFDTAVGAFARDDGYGALLFAATLDEGAEFHHGLLRRVAGIASAAGKPLIAVPITYPRTTSELVAGFNELHPGVLVAPVLDHALDAIAGWLGTEPAPAAPASVSHGGARQWRHEHAMKQLLQARGLNVPGAVWLEHDEQPTGLPGETVVVKGVGADIHHKGRLGLVITGVTRPHVHQAVERVRTAAAAAHATLDGVLIEAAVDGDTDLIVSLVRRDLGDVLLLGHGGGNVESGLPKTFSVLPVSDDRLRAVLTRLGIATPDPCIDLIRVVIDVFLQQQLSELELNPVRLDSSGTPWILDALSLA